MRLKNAHETAADPGLESRFGLSTSRMEHEQCRVRWLTRSRSGVSNRNCTRIHVEREEFSHLSDSVSLDCFTLRNFHSGESCEFALRLFV
jgi:hypothetical protein